MPAPPVPDTSTATTRAGTLALAAGLTVIGVTSITGASAPVSALAFAAWAAAPYAALWTVSRLTGSPWTIGGAGLAALVLEIAVRLTVFVVPRGSTAAVALVFSPAVIGVVAMPAGAALGWLAGRLWPRGRLVRAGVATVALGLAAWTIVGIAWPEQLPAARLARRRALDAIGAPRVVTGQDTWMSRAIPGDSAWPLAVDVDGDGDDELATVSAGTIAIRRLPSLDVVGSHALARPSSWSWYSRLARLGDALVVVATGGGFQETRVTDLDDRERWRYHPDATLPPTSLYPADLDADGATEFYATTATALVRLDGAGREQWRRGCRSSIRSARWRPSRAGPASSLRRSTAAPCTCGAPMAGRRARCRGRPTARRCGSRRGRTAPCCWCSTPPAGRGPGAGCARWASTAASAGASTRRRRCARSMS